MTVVFTCLGDSITTGGSGKTLSAGIADHSSWTYWAALGPEVSALGLIANAGETASQMLTRAVERRTANALVMLCGTNDMTQNHGRYWTAGSILKAWRAVAAEEVIQVAIPPREGREAEVADFNGWLAGFVPFNGGHFIDPWGPIRDENGCWLPECYVDGIHQAPAASEIVGNAIRAKLLTLEVS
jgi:hypothetical protein